MLHGHVATHDLGNPATIEATKTPCSDLHPKNKRNFKTHRDDQQKCRLTNSTHKRQPQRQRGVQGSLVQLLPQPPSRCPEQLKPSTAPFILVELSPFPQYRMLPSLSTALCGWGLMFPCHQTLPQHPQLEKKGISHHDEQKNQKSKGYHSHHIVTGCLYISEFSFVQPVSEVGTDFGRGP